MAFDIKSLLSSGAEGLIKGIGDTVDTFIRTKEEKDQAMERLSSLVMNFVNENDEQITKRLEADMKSDSWLANNVRPLSLVFTTLMVTFFAFFHGNLGQFTIDESYIDLFKGLLLLQYGFYFGSRGFEKIYTTINKNKK